MHHKWRKIYFLPLILILASCSTFSYHTTKVESKDFTQYRTYGWLSPVDSLSKGFFNNDIARSHILDAANDELEARGMRYTTENPDILFRYVAIVNNRSRLQHYYPPYYRWGGYYGWMWPRPFMYGPMAKEPYRLGHIIIEARDRRSNTVVWQARGSGEVRTPERAINNLAEVVRGVMAKYPVAGESRK